MAPVCSILDLPEIHAWSGPEWRTIYCLVLRVNLQMRPKAPDIYHVTDFTCNSRIAAGRPAVMVHDTPIDDDQVFTLDVFRAKTIKIEDAYLARTGMALGISQMIVAQRLSTHIADRMLVLKVDVSLKLFNGVLECRTGNIEVVAKDDPHPCLDKLFYNMCRYLPGDFFHKLAALSEMVVPERHWQDMYGDQPRSQVQRFAIMQRAAQKAAQKEAALDTKVRAPPLHLDSDYRDDLVSSPVLEREEQRDAGREKRAASVNADIRNDHELIAKRLRSRLQRPVTAETSSSSRNPPISTEVLRKEPVSAADDARQVTQPATMMNINGDEAISATIPINNNGGEALSSTTPINNDGDEAIATTVYTNNDGGAASTAAAEESTPNSNHRDTPENIPNPSLSRNKLSRHSTPAHGGAVDSRQHHNGTSHTSTHAKSSSRKLWTISELSSLGTHADTERIYTVRARLGGAIPDNWSFVCPKLYEFSQIAREYVLTDPRPRCLELILVDAHVEGPVLAPSQFLPVHIPGCDLALFFKATSIENFYVASGTANRFYLALLAREEPFTISLVQKPLPGIGKNPIMVWLPHNCTIEKLLSS